MLKVIFTLPFIFLFLNCASLDPINTDSPEGLYKMALELENQERFEESLAHLNELKNKHPYNKLATEAELKIANINFKKDDFLEAENSYKLFKEFHPKHEKIDFVTFRIAMSLYKQLPESIDRDLDVAFEAIKYFRQVYNNYPQSNYAGSAKDHEANCNLKIARKIYYVANFYFIRDMYDSALGRFEDILTRYPNVGINAKTLYGAAYSAMKTGEVKKSKKYYTKLLEAHPNSKWSDRAKNELGN